VNYLFFRQGDHCNDAEFLNEKIPSLRDTVKRLPSILTDFKIKSVDLFLNDTHVKVQSNIFFNINFSQITIVI